MKGKNAIRCCFCCCPQFSEQTIYLYGNFLSRKDNKVNTKNDNYQGFTRDYELNNGNQNFSVEELEVYKLTFE